MDFAAIADLVSTVGLIGGLLFAGFEWRASRREGRRERQLLLLRSFESPEFVRAMRVILDLPENLGRGEIEAAVGSDGADLIWYWLGVQESIGVLVFQRELDIRDVDQVFGGPIIVSFRKLRRYIHVVRAENGRDSMHEWFQWLAEHVEALEREEGRSAAHIREKDWRP